MIKEEVVHVFTRDREREGSAKEWEKKENGVRLLFMIKGDRRSTSA